MDPTGCTCTGINTSTSEVSWTLVEQCAGGGYEVRAAGQNVGFYRLYGRRRGREEKREGWHFRRGAGNH